MDHCQVEGAEVFVERKISEILIDVEEKCIFIILGRFRIRDPVQLVYKFIHVSEY
jgi:hypothetical protein